MNPQTNRKQAFMAHPPDTSLPVVHDDEHTYASLVARRVVLYVAEVFELLLALRVVLRLAGAPGASPFVQFAYRASGTLVSPFRGLFGPVSVSLPVEWAALAAMVVYALVAWGVMWLGWAATAHRDPPRASSENATRPAGGSEARDGGDVVR